METYLIIAAGAAWFIIGAAGFIYNWLKLWDFTVSEIPLALLMAVVGPIAWILGAGINRTKDIAKQNETAIKHVRQMTRFDRNINQSLMLQGKPMRVHPINRYVYFSNPHHSKVLIRTTNKITKRLQAGEVL